MTREDDLAAEVKRLRRRVRELEANEAWNEEQVAAFLGFTVARSVQAWCSHWRVKREPMARAADVRAAKAKMPGRGARTDLKEA